MKIPPFLHLVLIIYFSSCSSKEISNSTNEHNDLLKSFKVIKNAQGKFSINYDVNNNVISEVVNNFSTKTKEIYLFDGKSADRNNFTEALILQENQLKVDFTENNKKRKSLIIEDTNIVLAKGKDNNEFLTEYSIEDIGNNSFKLDFKVKKGVVVSFIYNKKDNINEVHLRRGNENSIDFSKTYLKTSKILKIDFVNHIDFSAKSNNFKARHESSRKPRVVLIE